MSNSSEKESGSREDTPRATSSWWHPTDVDSPSGSSSWNYGELEGSENSETQSSEEEKEMEEEEENENEEDEEFEEVEEEDEEEIEEEEENEWENSNQNPSKPSTSGRLDPRNVVADYDSFWGDTNSSKPSTSGILDPKKVVADYTSFWFEPSSSKPSTSGISNSSELDRSWSETESSKPATKKERLPIIIDSTSKRTPSESDGYLTERYENLARQLLRNQRSESQIAPAAQNKEVDWEEQKTNRSEKSRIRLFNNYSSASSPRADSEEMARNFIRSTDLEKLIEKEAEMLNCEKTKKERNLMNGCENLAKQLIKNQQEVQHLKPSTSSPSVSPKSTEPTKLDPYKDLAQKLLDARNFQNPRPTKKVAPLQAPLSKGFVDADAFWNNPIQVPLTDEKEQLLAYREEIEKQRNVFTNLMDGSYQKKKKNKNKNKDSSPSSFKSLYTHNDAMKFAAMTYLWKDNRASHLPSLPRQKTFHLPDREIPDKKIHAFYRVLVEKENKYILIACHMNLHGFHRGDIRFLEVNDRTVLSGFEGASVMGNLFPGDIVAVTELARLPHSSSSIPSVSQVTLNSNLTWMVSKMILPERPAPVKLSFCFLKNRMAVVKGNDEPLKVLIDDWNKIDENMIYKGTAFVPMKMEYNFTSDFQKKTKNQIIAKTTAIASYPNSFGTIYEFEACESRSDLFNIGVKAFDSSMDSEPESYKEQVVETCARMGYSAASTIFNGRFDCRAFQMLDIQDQGNFVKFSIENPSSQPTLGLWNTGNRILFGGPTGDVFARIETVMVETEGFLRIVARISRDSRKGSRLDFQRGEFFVSQREIPEMNNLPDGFFRTMNLDSNGRKIIETLYGAPPLKLVKPLMGVEEYSFPGESMRLNLNEYQCEYVQMILDGNPLVVGSSPFGCGKSMTIVTAAIEIHLRNLTTTTEKKQQLLVTQSNYASVNLIEIASKAMVPRMKVVRFVSEKNWNEMAENCRTRFDMPKLMEFEFRNWAKGYAPEQDDNSLSFFHKDNIVSYLLKNDMIKPREFAECSKVVYDENPCVENRQIAYSVLTSAFFMLYQPDIIVSTADSSKQLLPLLTSVTTVQIDEASQVPEYTLLSLISSYPNANFGLIGDIHQLPPYCEESLTGKLKEYGIGNTMERCIKEKKFPQANLRYVYRCHPKITSLLSDLFYDGSLISGIQEKERNEFIVKRSDIWRNPDYPIMIVDHKNPGYHMGTSVANNSEVDLVRTIFRRVCDTFNGHRLQPSDIGVISFYTAQTSLLTEEFRGTGIKCGTVDAFQGTEREVIIVCCTNKKISDFMQLGNRLNVALSRAKQATFIIGNVDGLRTAKYWSRIVEKVEKHGNLVNVDKLGSLSQASSSSSSVTSKSSSSQRSNFENPPPYRPSQRLPEASERQVQPKIKHNRSEPSLPPASSSSYPTQKFFYENPKPYRHPEEPSRKPVKQQPSPPRKTLTEEEKAALFKGRWDVDTY